MFAATSPYIMAVTMMVFSGSSALTLIAFLRSLDPPEDRKTDDRVTKHAA